MKTFARIALLALAPFATAASAATPPAAIADSQWRGSAELTLDGKLWCSGDAAHSPRVVERKPAYLSVRRGGEGWIWPQFSGGCAAGWLGDFLAMRVSGSDLLDARGAKVGSITDSRISARGFVGAYGELSFRTFELTTDGAGQARAVVEFERVGTPGLFRYTADFRPFSR